MTYNICEDILSSYYYYYYYLSYKHKIISQLVIRDTFYHKLKQTLFNLLKTLTRKLNLANPTIDLSTEGSHFLFLNFLASF